MSNTIGEMEPSFSWPTQTDRQTDRQTDTPATYTEHTVSVARQTLQTSYILQQQWVKYVHT